MKKTQLSTLPLFTIRLSRNLSFPSTTVENIEFMRKGLSQINYCFNSGYFIVFALIFVISLFGTLIDSWISPLD